MLFDNYSIKYPGQTYRSHAVSINPYAGTAVSSMNQKTPYANERKKKNDGHGCPT